MPEPEELPDACLMPSLMPKLKADAIPAHDAAMVNEMLHTVVLKFSLSRASSGEAPVTLLMAMAV